VCNTNVAGERFDAWLYWADLGFLQQSLMVVVVVVMMMMMMIIIIIIIKRTPSSRFLLEKLFVSQLA